MAAVAAVPLFEIAGTAITLGDIASGIGLVTQVMGFMTGGAASAQASNQNAAIERAHAVQQQQAADANAEQQRQDNKRRQGDIAASYGASGVETDSGSPLDVLADQAAQGELAARLKSYQGTVGANASLAQAQLDSIQAQQAQEGALWKSAGSLLTGGLKFGSNSVPAPSPQPAPPPPRNSPPGGDPATY